jgi:hypothetical protein
MKKRLAWAAFGLIVCVTWAVATDYPQMSGDATVGNTGVLTVIGINGTLLSGLSNGVYTWTAGVPSALGYTPVKLAGDIAGGSATVPQVTGVNGTAISTSSSVIQRLDGAGHFKNAVYYVDGLLVTPTASTAYSQGLIASGNGGFYLAETFLDVATAASGTCTAIPYLSYTNEAGVAVTQAMTATAFNFAGSSSSMGYSQPIQNGTTASVSISVTPSSTCSGGTFNMHSRLIAQ